MAGKGDYRWVRRGETFPRKTFPRNVSTTWWQDVLWWSAVGFAIGVGAGWLIRVATMATPTLGDDLILFAGLGLMWIGAVNAVDWWVGRKR